METNCEVGMNCVSVTYIRLCIAYLGHSYCAMAQNLQCKRNLCMYTKFLAMKLFFPLIDIICSYK